MLAETLSRLIDRIYAAAEGAEPWTTPLGELRTLLRGRMTSLLEHGGGAAPDVVRAAVGLDPAHRESYERYYWRRNVYLHHAASVLRPGIVAPHEMYCSDRDILRSEYYQDFQRHLGLFRVVAGVTTRRNRQTVLVTVSRALSDRPFTSEETRMLQLLLPHFQRGIAIHDRLQPLPTQAAGETLGLTPAEASIAEQLKAGRSVAQICQSLNIRETTVRTHLRHLFQKTQTRRQAELVAHLLRH
jgi:DNA-binding CsgD family transcriptional regulator